MGLEGLRHKTSKSLRTRRRDGKKIGKQHFSKAVLWNTQQKETQYFPKLAHSSPGREKDGKTSFFESRALKHTAKGNTGLPKAWNARRAKSYGNLRRGRKEDRENNIF